jgi:hypothetical protein
MHVNIDHIIDALENDPRYASEVAEQLGVDLNEIGIVELAVAMADEIGDTTDTGALR